MPAELILPYVMRYVHIASAILMIGGPFFVWFAFMPAARRVLDEESHRKLSEAVNGRWRHMVYLLITLFLISGLYTFLVPVRVNGVLITSRWRDFGESDKRLYHMIFGFKMIAAFGIFFLASALAGRTKTFAGIRAKRKTFIAVLLLLAAGLLVCSTWLRYLPTQEPPKPFPSPLVGK
ncbi:MAG TPA: hypothetical protein VH253_18250 [Phycisphaerae bacterium]|nr:hypothetical protein [Phycisphaerae bacterium]